MPATTASAHGRRVLRASVIGLGLLVSAGVLAPPALAAPATADSPSVATGSAADGIVHVRLVAAPVPADLDLSGARFDVLDGSGAVVGSCVSDALGACDVPLVPSAGATYRLVQDAGSPVPGLVPSTVEPPVVLCSPDDTGCQDPLITVTDASLFRSGLSVTVRDGTTQAPVAGAEFSLTGPDYPHVPAAAQEGDTTLFPAPTLSGADGRLTFPYWFLPGEWALFPEVTPRGYASSGVLPVTLPAGTAGSADTWTDTVELAPDSIALTGSGRGPARPPVVPPTTGPAPAATTTAAAARPAAATAPSLSPSTAPVSSPAAPSRGPVAPTSPAAPSESASVLPRDDAGAPSPSVGAPAPATDSPALRAEASASPLDVDVISFGVLFLALVVVGVGLVRQRVRRS